MAEIIYDSFDGSINPIKYFAKSPEAAAHTIGFKTRLTGSVFMSAVCLALCTELREENASPEKRPAM